MTASESPVESPFVVLVDSAESHPFTFQGLRADADKGGRPLVVQCRRDSLGRYPCSLGDYSAEGLVGHAHVERKSVEDCQSTVLGWDTYHERQTGQAGRRERFKQELANLQAIPCGLVVVEGSLADCLATMPSWGRKTREENAKAFMRSVAAFMQDYRVPWLFCESRRHAEITTYRWLERAWRKQCKEAGAGGTRTRGSTRKAA